MEFELNGTNWKIKFSNKDYLLKRYNKENKEKAFYVFGYCDFAKHVIHINSELEKTQTLQTLRHELAHCWLWCIGAYKDNYTQEELCDIVASMCDFIYEVTYVFKERWNYKKNNDL